jgi:hypothetical protein
MCFGAAFITCAHVWLGIRSLIVMDVLPYCWALTLITWMQLDALHRNRVPCFDFGLILAVTWPFSLVWYCPWSRGWRGWLVLLWILGLYVWPWMVAVMLWIGLRLTGW